MGRDILLEFKENPPADPTKPDRLLAPTTTVNVFLSVTAPCVGHFSSRVAHGVVETVGAICTFALGRGVKLPTGVFPAQPDLISDLEGKHFDLEVLTLARKHIGLDIFSSLVLPGRIEYFLRLRSAFLTFDAAIQQEHDAVACILYVVTAEAISMPAAPWRNSKLTKRFVEYYNDLMPSTLDKMVTHGNFERVFGIKIGARPSRILRRKMLEEIYDFRSGHLHSGLHPSYRGFGSGIEMLGEIRRGLLADFAEGAILAYISSPRSSLIGHPDWNRELK